MPPRSMLGRLCTFVTFIANDAIYIRDIDERIIPLRPNAAQVVLLASWMLQAARDKPIRTVVLKARKVGVSTWVQAFLYFLCRHYRNQRALTLAHQTEATHEIFNIARRIGQKDPTGSPRVNRTLLMFWPSDSLYSCHTAGAEGEGAGGSYNLLHRSEMALWKRSKAETIKTSGDAVATTLTSVIVDESTARGREAFYAEFEAAHRLEHPYEPVFIPWFLDDRLSWYADSAWTPSDDERVLGIRAAGYGLTITPEQFAWRRMKIDEIGPDDFRQEFPSTPEEAIQSRRGLILPGMRECVIQTLPFLYRETPHDERVGGYDYGYSDPTALGAGIYRDQVLYVIRVWRGAGKLASAFVGEVLDGHTYYCDPANPGPRDQLAQDSRAHARHARFRSAPRATGTAERSIVKQELDVVRRMMAEGRLKILAGQEHQLVIEADSFDWNESTGEPDKTRSLECGHFDALDMLRYMVMGCVATGAMPERRKRPTNVRAQLRTV